MKTLSRHQFLSDLLNKLCHLEHHLHVPHDSLSNFYLANWGPTLSLIEKLSRRHTNVGMMTIVVEKLNQRKVVILAPTKVNDAGSQHILKSLNSLLTLAIRL